MRWKGGLYLTCRVAEPATPEEVTLAIDSGVRTDVGQIITDLKAHKISLRERSERFLAFVEEKNRDYVAIAEGIRRGDVDYQMLGGPIEAGVERAILEARLLRAAEVLEAAS